MSARQISDTRAPFATVDDAITAGHEWVRQNGTLTGISAEPQAGGYFCRLRYTLPTGGGRQKRNRRQDHMVEIGKLPPPEPINDTWLSGRPYYCNACGLGYAEFLACEDGGCDLETQQQAQARLAKAHAEGKGMPSP